MTTLEFLTYLAKNPQRQLDFKREPLSTARAAGLDDATIEVLATRNAALLRQLLQESAATEGPERAVVYTPERAVIYTPERAIIYTSERKAA